MSNTMTDTVAVPREPTEGHDGAVLATDLALLNALVYTHGGDAALAGWVRIVRALSAAPKPQPASQGEGVSAEEHRQRGVRLVGMTEWAGAHLCRAEKAEARAAELEAQIAFLLSDGALGLERDAADALVPIQAAQSADRTKVPQGDA